MQVEKRNCGFCGNEFETTRGWKEYCNDRCRQDAWNKMMTEAKGKMQQWQRASIVGKIFLLIRNRYPRDKSC